MMNERIKELYEQAIVIEDGGDYVCGELDPVKFAALIVKECAQVASDYDGAHYVGAAIEEHFGVEEQNSTCPDCGADGGTQCGSINCGY